jgi:hypothetical protein
LCSLGISTKAEELDLPSLNWISIFTLLMTMQMMKPKPDFNIYIINDNADDETNIEIGFCFHHLHCH